MFRSKNISIIALAIVATSMASSSYLTVEAATSINTIATSDLSANSVPGVVLHKREPFLGWKKTRASKKKSRRSKASSSKTNVEADEKSETSSKASTASTDKSEFTDTPDHVGGEGFTDLSSIDDDAETKEPKKWGTGKKVAVGTAALAGVGLLGAAAMGDGGGDFGNDSGIDSVGDPNGGFEAQEGEPDLDAEATGEEFKKRSVVDEDGEELGDYMHSMDATSGMPSSAASSAAAIPSVAVSAVFGIVGLMLI